MGNRRKIHVGLGMALPTALICVMGSACVEARDSSVDEEATSEVEQAFMNSWRTVCCSMPGSGATGRRWGTLSISDEVVDAEGRHSCYRFPDVNRVEAPLANTMSCEELAQRLGCATLVDL
ncbi:hypothetical protein [Sorangium sp. So ce1078]|uniref:hypothetical protein n=1 Tax=Sorangium sp. So ce1078 TaxID=3133329 RepID=UPI003F6071CE